MLNWLWQGVGYPWDLVIVKFGPKIKKIKLVIWYHQGKATFKVSLQSGHHETTLTTNLMLSIIELIYDGKKNNF